MIQAMALRPDIRAFAGFGEALYPGGLLERRVQELVIITASQRSECQFCENAHVDMVDIEGIIDDPLSHIADPGPLPARERLAVLYTQAVVADSNNLPDGLMTEIHANFSDPETGRADVPGRLYQPAQPVQQQSRSPLSGRTTGRCWTPVAGG
jgi:alkylhydroperoxidase family enzyme